MESDKKPSGFAGRGCESGPALVFCHEGCVNPRLIFLTPQSYASPIPGGEEGGMSAKGPKAIVHTMCDDMWERMLGLLSQAIAGERPPKGDDARLQGNTGVGCTREDLAGCAPAGLSCRPTGRRLASARSQRWAWRRTRGSRPRDRGRRPTSRARPTRHPRRSLPGSAACPPGGSTATSCGSRGCTRPVAPTTRSGCSATSSHAPRID